MALKFSFNKWLNYKAKLYIKKKTLQRGIKLNIEYMYIY